MAKYLIIEDFEVQWIDPTTRSNALSIFKKDNVIEAAISPVDGALVTLADGSLPSFKDGEILLKVVEPKVKLIDESNAADLAKKQAMMKWVYLGGAALVLWWFVYGREKKKKYSETSAGYAGTDKPKRSKKPEIYEFSVPTWALPYLINNDPSGLSKEEIKKVDKFSAEVYSLTKSDISMGSGWDEEGSFKWRNDIDGSLGANVVEVKVAKRN